jgi:hypothetical protein
MPIVGPTYDDPRVREEALRYIARFGEPDKAAAIIDKFDDVPMAETRLVLIRFMQHVSGQTYDMVPRHTYETYLVESLAKNPFPSVKPPGIEPRN